VSRRTNGPELRSKG